MNKNIINENNERQYYIDYAKCLAIVFMIAVHVFWKLGSEFEDSIGYAINFYLGGFMAAPVFMTAMGVGFDFTKNKDSNSFIQRGINILILGYLLNLIRELPVFLYYVFNSDFKTISLEFLSELVQGDILQFAGLAMILFGLLKKINFSENKILIIACIMSIIGTLVPSILTDSIPLNASLGLLSFVDYPEETIMCFPLLTWFIYPSFGYWLSKKILKTNNKEIFFKITLLPCFILSFLCSLYEKNNSIYMMKSNSEYYHMCIYDALISICYVIFCFGLFFFICKKLPEKLNKFVASISNSLNLIYLIHWPLIYIVMLIMVRIKNIEFTNINGFIFTIIINVISIWLGVFLKKYISNKVKKNPNTFLRYIK